MPLTPSRRRVLEAAAALTAASALPRAVTAQATNPVASGLAPATSFLATLDPAQRKAATVPWGGQQWRAWNYYGVGGYIKPGLRLEQMQAAQKD